MSSFYRLLDEHKLLLQSKGYDEKQLSSPDRDGWILSQLTRSLSDAVHEGFSFNTTVDFAIDAAGFFGNDIVHYGLHYRFDPQTEALNMQHLDVRWNNHCKRISLKTNHDLPTAKDALDHIKSDLKLGSRQHSRNCKKGRK